MRAVRAAVAVAAIVLLAGCAVPPVDRFQLQSERVPLRLEGARGPLTHARSAQILADLKRRSPETSIFDRHLAVEEAITGSPLSTGNRVTLLQDGAATYDSMLAAIRSARHHVHLESYIFDGDAVGRAFAEALIARRAAGVEVRIIVDGLGSIATRQEFFQGLADAGIEVYEFNPVTVGSVLTQGTALNRRDHRKLIVVDGRTAFLGGINISGVYTSGGVIQHQKGGITGSGGDADTPFEERPWRDTQVRIEGPVVEALQRSFLKMWGQMQKQPALTGERYYPRLEPQGPHVVRAMEGWTPEGLNPNYVTLLSAIESAETRVRITNAYFVPHQELLDALKQAARRGVDVQLVLPSRTDHWLVFHAGRSYYDELLEAGVRIHERETRVLHAKTASVDKVWSTVGSTNLDWRSLAFNDEINIVVLGPEFAAQLDAAFDRDLAYSHEVTLAEWRHRPWKDRALEFTAQFWARLL